MTPPCSRNRHDAVLKELAEVAELCRQETNSQPAAPARRSIHFARAGEHPLPVKHGKAPLTQQRVEHESQPREAASGP